MKTNYFTKVENKYVFNMSLMFWHLFIALATLAIIVCTAVFLWSIIPPSQRKVEKQPYPEKQHYPEPVKVYLNELKLDEVKQEEAPPTPEQIQTATSQVQQPIIEDTRGKAEYEASLNALKNLIPPTKYSWKGSGYWTFPYGERYWTYYKQEIYRQWNVTEAGVEDKLKSSFHTANAKNYPDKKQILDGYIEVTKLIPEEKRLSALQNLINNVSDNISQNINVCQSIAKVVSKMPSEENTWYINQLSLFGKKNPNDGPAFIDYVSTIIDKFDASQRNKIINGLTNSYYNYFNQKIANQKEATDLLVPLLAQMKGEYHSKALMQYYGLYLNKNYERDNAIAQIENEYQQKINEIDNQYNLEQANSMMEYQGDKAKKSEFRYKSVVGIGGGIVLIVLIATVLVFFSIQRSVRKIEEKISTDKNS